MPAANKQGGVGRGQYGPSLKIVYSGPFFEKDPARTFRQNAKAFIDDVVDDAYQTVLKAAPIYRGYYKAALRRQYGGVKSGSRRRWELTGVVSMRKLAAPTWHNPDHHSRHWFTQGRTGLEVRSGGFFNYAGKVEARHHPFRKGMSRLYSARKHNADLLRGLG